MYQMLPMDHDVNICNAMLHDNVNFRRRVQMHPVNVASHVAHGNRDACMHACDSIPIVRKLWLTVI